MTQRAVAGRYVLEEALGSSSWRATDTELGRQVLVRLGPPAENASALLSHPSIARVFDQGEADGEPYAVLEFLPGGTLEARLPELRESEARAAAADVAAAVEYAHAQGVVHGSLSLANILLDGEGRAKVAGFGGSGTPEEDMQALESILASLAQVAPAPAPDDVEEATAVIAPPRAAAGRRTGVLVAAAAITLLVAGVSAAFLATGDSTKPPTGSLSVPVPSQTTAEETEAPPPQPTDTAETTTTTTAATTTEPQPTTAPTTAPPPATTLPPPLPTTVELPPTTTEELPPATTETTPIEPP